MADICCFRRGPRFSSHHPHGGFQPSVITIQRIQCPQRALGTHVVCVCSGQGQEMTSVWFCRYNPPWLLLLLLLTGSPYRSGSHLVGRLVTQQVPGIYLSYLPSAGQSAHAAMPSVLFYMCSGALTQVCVLVNHNQMSNPIAE